MSNIDPYQPITMETVDGIIAALTAALQHQRTCIAYQNDTDTPYTAVLVNYTLTAIAGIPPTVPDGHPCLELQFQCQADGSSYPLQIDITSPPSEITIDAGAITITDYRLVDDTVDPCGWTTITWIPEKHPDIIAHLCHESSLL